jgi:hypothetical protein
MTRIGNVATTPTMDRTSRLARPRTVGTPKSTTVGACGIAADAFL